MPEPRLDRDRALCRCAVYQNHLELLADDLIANALDDSFVEAAEHIRTAAGFVDTAADKLSPYGNEAGKEGT